jgi:hypothetical protein
MKLGRLSPLPELLKKPFARNKRQLQVGWKK